MLNLNELAAGEHPGITAEKGAELAQAGAVCLEERGHAQGVMLTVRGSVSNSYRLDWTSVTPQARRTWADDDEATEDGAACIAALVANREIGQAVVVRAARRRQRHQPTGFDYWLGDDNIANTSEAERVATDSLATFLDDGGLVVRTRLEVSGIRNDNDSVIRTRVRRKLRQMDRSDTLGLPAYAIVVEFGRPLAEVRRK